MAASTQACDVILLANSEPSTHPTTGEFDGSLQRVGDGACHAFSCHVQVLLNRAAGERPRTVAVVCGHSRLDRPGLNDNHLLRVQAD